MDSGEFIRLGQKIVKCNRGYQKALADKLGLSVRTVQRMASGKQKVKLTTEKLMREIEIK
jgi:hypothetical protein